MNNERAPESADQGNLFRALWAVADDATTRAGAKRREQRPLGWMLGGAAVVFMLVVGLLTYMTIMRGERAMSTLLAEKGASLLGVFESALRTSMRGSSGLQLQTLLEEMVRGPDIEFVAVTMPDGSIIAHSDRNRLGELLILEGKNVSQEQMDALGADEDEKWKVVEMEGRRVFLLYRHFTLGNKNWPEDVPEPTIFLGMELSPFEITNSQNRSFSAMLSVVILLVGLACLLALDYAQRAKDSRRRQRKAEGEVRRLEEEMRRQEKLAAVGTLAAGVAHEIRNPLSSIKGYATYFGQLFPEDSEDREAANMMVSEVNRLNRVITDLLGLSRPSDVRPKPVRAQDVVEYVLRLMRQTTRHQHVRVVCRFAPRVPEVLADIERLSQALLNICLNAVEAMTGGGELTIAVSGGKKRVCIVARDTGEGIDADALNKIFDPYFTTKGSGTGLGLPMTYKIVRAHGGQISVKSRRATHERAGETIFRIWLPVAEQEGMVEKGMSPDREGAKA